MKIRKILIAQPEPTTEKSPYADLTEKYGVTVDFRPFVRVEGVSIKEFRQQRIDILTHTAVVFTARTAVDHFFRICEELRIVIPETMKYFCTTEAIALYLQKYIVYRKRKIFFGNGPVSGLLEAVGTKHKNEKFLIALSDTHKNDIPKAFTKAKLAHTDAVFYKTINYDIKDCPIKDYDIIVFYSPAEIKSFKENFPDFEQNKTIIATFGAATAKLAATEKMKVEIQAPTPEAPSMKMALEAFLKNIK